MRQAVRVTLVVGPVLTIINQAHNIVALELGPRFFVQTVLTFCVPYMVSTYSSAMTRLAHARQDGTAATGAGDPAE